MIPNKIGYLLTILTTLTLFATSCDSHEEKDLYTTIKNRSLDTVLYPLFSSLQYDRLIAVHHKLKSIDSFFVYERKSIINNGYKCSGCHSKPIRELKAKKTFAHKDIRFFHMSLEEGTCFTCHNQKNMDELRSHSGKSIDFNKSYKLCAQCHQKEYNDWGLGAHGKEVGGWTPPRVSKNCVECHNPHSPKFHSKIPAYPVYLKRIRTH